MIKIAEIFKSIQGEGKHAGMPMTFVRTSGCTRKCSFCDTKYHTMGEGMTIDEVIEKLPQNGIVCWTGGEPLLWRKEIKEIITRTNNKNHIETNGDLLRRKDFDLFNYVSCSPKTIKTAKKVSKLLKEFVFDIKIVTDMKNQGVDMLRYATIVMPLNTYDKKVDDEIKKVTWNYCVRNNKKLTIRLQSEVWGKEKGI